LDVPETSPIKEMMDCRNLERKKEKKEKKEENDQVQDDGLPGQYGNLGVLE
jgi:hypothetical protein